MSIKFAATHEWLDERAGSARIGISAFAAGQLGDIVFIDLPAVGDVLTCGETFGNIETVKAVSDVYSPVTGVVTAVNETLLDDPAALSDDPMGAWLIEAGDITATGELMDEAAYAAHCEEESHG